jgi:hypothetical protein
MNDEPQDLADFILAEDLQAEIVAPGAQMPTVDAAAAAMRVAPEQIFKSIVFQSPAGRCVLVVASGNARVDRQRVEVLTGFFGLKLAKPGGSLGPNGLSCGRDTAGGTPGAAAGDRGHAGRFPALGVRRRWAARAVGEDPFGGYHPAYGRDGRRRHRE